MEELYEHNSKDHIVWKNIVKHKYLKFKKKTKKKRKKKTKQKESTSLQESLTATSGPGRGRRHARIVNPAENR